MFALLAALLLLPAQLAPGAPLGPDSWTAHVLSKAPGQSWTVASGAGAWNIAAYGNVAGTDYPNKTRAFLLGVQGYVDVTPAGFAGAQINDSSGLQHVGGAGSLSDYPFHAWLWTDLGPSKDLHPAGYDVSEALGVGGGRQVGYVYPGGYCAGCGLVVQRHAAMWTGSANSMELLHSHIANYSVAVGTDGVQQVGHGMVGMGFHALLWNSTGSSVVDLNPGPGYFLSLAGAVDAGQQVGSVAGADTASWSHAALWTGTAASFEDLNPHGYVESNAWSVRGGVQVGSGSLTGQTSKYRALAWQGSALGFIELHDLLPSDFQFWNSSAEDIDAQGNIVGFVEFSGVSHPVVWLRNKPMLVADASSLGVSPLK